MTDRDELKKKGLEGLEPVDPAEVVPPERVPLERMDYGDLIRHEAEKARGRGAGIAGLYLGDPNHTPGRLADGTQCRTVHPFPLLQEAIDGVQAGFYIIAADSNVGKTALLVNLCAAILEYNADARCLFFSLDDSRLKIHRRLLTRLLAPTLGVKIQNVGKRLGEADQGKREAAEARLLEWYQAGRLDIPAIDGESVTAAIEARILEEVERIGGADDDPQERPRLAVFIDGLHYLDTPDTKGTPSETQEEKAQAEKVKEWVNRYNLPVVTTAELRKKDKRGGGEKDKAFTWPTMQDIAGSRRFAYRADLVLMVWADSATAAREKDIYTIRMLPDKNKLGPGKAPIRAAFDRYRVRIIEDQATGPERQDADIDRAIRDQKAAEEKARKDKERKSPGIPPFDPGEV